VSALLDSGLPEATGERVAAEGGRLQPYGRLRPVRARTSLRSKLRLVPGGRGPEPLSCRGVYEVLGLPEPDPSAAVQLDEEAMFERFRKDGGCPAMVYGFG
jgi:hypothetical protein